MGTIRAERRLAAIMAADIVSYSRLVQVDEVATLAAIRSLRSEVIEPLLAEYSGRIVKLMGDGALVEFGSVVDAVSCAAAIQKSLAARQADVASDRRIVFRIGINLGDVVVEGSDLLGDGVNVAARLEQLCPPGGVLISGTAYDHMKGKLDLPLDYVGEQQVKNMPQPVRTYRVRMDGSTPGWWLQARRFRRWMPGAAVLLLALFLLGAGVWWFRPLETTPAKASIAVLPFENKSGDADQAYFAEGLTDDLITDLSKISGLFVIARNSTSGYDPSVDVRAGCRAAQGPLCTPGQRSPRRQFGPNQRAAGRRHDWKQSLGGALRPRLRRDLRAAGRGDTADCRGPLRPPDRK